MTQIEQRFFDVISHTSNSYFTDKHEILVPVGQGDAELPPVPMSRRMFGKHAAQAMKVNRPGVAPSQEKAVHVAAASGSIREPSEPGVPSGVLGVPGVPSGAPGVPSAVPGVPAAPGEAHVAKVDACAESPPAAKERLEREYQEDRERALDLKAHFKKYRNSVSTQLVLEDMQNINN